MDVDLREWRKEEAGRRGRLTRHVWMSDPKRHYERPIYRTDMGQPLERTGFGEIIKRKAWTCPEWALPWRAKP